MGACTAAGRAAEAYHLTGSHPVSGLDVDAGQVTVEGLYSVHVTYDHEVAVGSQRLGYADLAVESGVDGSARRQRQIDTLMAPAATGAELAARIDGTYVRTAVLAQTVHEPDGPAGGQTVVRNLVRVARAVAPGPGEYVLVTDKALGDEILPGVVAVKYDLDVIVHGR